MKSFLGNFYRHLAIFFWSHWYRRSVFEAQTFLDRKRWKNLIMGCWTQTWSRTELQRLNKGRALKPVGLRAPETCAQDLISRPCRRWRLHRWRRATTSIFAVTLHVLEKISWLETDPTFFFRKRTLNVGIDVRESRIWTDVFAISCGINSVKLFPLKPMMNFCTLKCPWQIDKLGPILLNYFCRNWTAVKLWQDFDVLCVLLSEFSSMLATNE